MRMTNLGAHVYRIGGMPDHVHILVDISAKNSLSDFVKKLKQESSFLIARHPDVRLWVGKRGIPPSHIRPKILKR